MTKLLPIAAIAALLAPLVPSALAGESAVAARLTFEHDVRPILKAMCFRCHGEGEKPKGGLDLRLRRLIVAGGESGPALVPGNRDESYLLQRIAEREMPPGEKKLSSEQVATIGRWISQGAVTAAPEPEEIGDAYFTHEERNYWAFRPVQRPPLPEVQHAGQVRSPVDAFLLARLEAAGSTFSPAADRRTLIRRATFDLLGLPPTPEEVERFVADDAPDAWGRLIDRLLASPRYGERWGRHWLDVAGYADSEGYTNDDAERQYAYKYRDYVIRAFNADKPWDVFLREQLAGDEMVAPPYKNLADADIEKLVATGFLRMAPDGTASGGIDQPLARNQVLADTLQIVGTSLLGLTVGCAQCHNHRYDPIPQADYYRLRAIFEPAYNPAAWRNPRGRLVSLYTDADRQAAAEVEARAAEVDKERLAKQAEYIERTFQKELEKLPEELREPIRQARETAAGKRTEEQKQLLKEHPSVNVTAGSLYLYDRKAADELKAMAAKAAEIRGTKPVEEFVRCLTEVPGQVPVTRFFFRGDHQQPRQELLPGELSVLAAAGSAELPENDSALPTTGRRLAYARHLTDGRHPLLARVLVNRFWMHHFGRGIVATPGDFGFLGERPTHPQLLDWLADEFVRGGWRLKRLHKLIMTSRAYVQSATRSEQHDAVDPDNRLLGRMNVRRLEAEVLRDAILAVSGKLNGKPFGPPVPVMEDEVGQFVIGRENKNGENRPGKVIPLGGEEYRRSLYVQVRRSRPLSVLAAFDAPAMDPNCEARNASTVAPQALMLMNSGFVVEQAEHFAARVEAEAGDEPAAQVARAWQLAFASAPDEEALEAALTFLREQTEYFRQQAAKATDKKVAGPNAESRALASLCHALLSSNAFLYVD